MPAKRKHVTGRRCFCMVCKKEWRAASQGSKRKAPVRLTDAQASRALCQWLEKNGVNCTLAILNGRNLVWAREREGYIYRPRAGGARLSQSRRRWRNATPWLDAPGSAVAARWLSGLRSDVPPCG